MGAKASSLQPPSKPAPNVDSQCKDDATVAKKPGEMVVVAIDDGPLPVISLASGHFAAKILLSVGVFVVVLSVFARGVTIHKHVWDTLGTSTRVDKWVEIYQVANGLVTTVIGNVFEGYVTVFIAVATIFMRNVRWYPGDDPSAGPSRIKKLVLWVFCPVVVYNIHVGITATFVSYTTTDVVRVFLEEDLRAVSGLLETPVLNTTTAAKLRSTGNGASVLDTILRGAVLQKVVPFQMNPNSACGLGNKTIDDDPLFELPTVKEVRSTAVVYGFPTRYWNVDAVPFGLKPNDSFTCTLNNGTISSEESTAFEAFLDVTNVSWLMMYESFLQGKLLFERSVSDANASAAYPCFWSDDKHELDLRSNDSTIIPNGNIFSEGQYKGKRRCFGAVSSLGALGNISDPTKHNVDSFLTSVNGAFLKTADQIEPESMKLTLDEYKINSQLKLTSMTLDMQYYKERQYRDTSMFCNGSSLLPDILDTFTADTDTADDIERMRTILCDQENYPYLEHQVMFKIPFLSLALTFTGLLLLRLLALVATVTPVPRLRMTEDADESVGHQYARLRQEDEYPRQVFDRGLKLRTGRRVALDNYVVESLTLHHKANGSKKAHL